MRVSISVSLLCICVVVPFIATVTCTRDNNNTISTCTWAPPYFGKYQQLLIFLGTKFTLHDCNIVSAMEAVLDQLAALYIDL